MSLAAGARLGCYDIVAPLGAGGMGEVYLARDARLNRDVAIKVLPVAFASDPERLARFNREAQMLASLNHPNIAAIYEFEHAEDTHALVLELVDGPTLADRIARGPIPLDEALPIARQIVDALEAAHERGIVHRDLKPANIKLRSDGTVKVLDFGLAKLVDPVAASGQRDSAVDSRVATITTPAVTVAGVLLGTAAYMSPEQAKGRPADRRSDIWAFGCVLYEMLTGRKMFDAADSVSDAVAAVLRDEPEWNALPADTPSYLRRLLRRCLVKDPQRRLPHIGLVRIDIDEAGVGEPLADAGAAAQVANRTPRSLAFGAAAAFCALAGVWGGWYLFRSPAPSVVRVPIGLGDDETLTGNGRKSIAIAPDGQQIAYVANRKLFRRSLLEFESHAIVNEDARVGVVTNPVFSPEGRLIAYVSDADRTLKRVGITGGTPVVISTLDAVPFGVTWDARGLLFECDGAIMLISPEGGKPATLIPRRTSDRLRDPHMLPDGHTIVYTVVDAATNTRNLVAFGRSARLVAQSIDPPGEPRTLIDNAMEGRYLSTGDLTYVSGNVLFAVSFDPRRATASGGPMPLVQGLRSQGGIAEYDVSATGTLVYVPGTESGAAGDQSLGFIDRGGKVELLKLPPARFVSPRLSPDGRQIAVEIDSGGDANVWVYDLSGSAAIRRLTFGGRNRVPVWSTDGRRIAFQSDRDGDRGIFIQRADGAGQAERLTTADKESAHTPESFSPRGDLLFTVTTGAESTLWAYLAATRTTRALDTIHASRQPLNAAFSPDGAWIAYQANDSGTSAVFVQPFPPTGARFQASPETRDDDPHHPVWSRDGTELFYVAGPNRFVVTKVTKGEGLSFSNPVRIQTGAWKNTFGGPTTLRNYDVAPDANRFLGVIASGATDAGLLRAAQIHLVVNWVDELKARTAAK